MGTPAYNLVRVNGSTTDLENFQKAAFKRESKAFEIEQLSPIEPYDEEDKFGYYDYLDYREEVYGSPWVGKFSVLIEKTESSLQYFFNSRSTKANMEIIASQYVTLSFTHVFCEAALFARGIIEYENCKKVSEIILSDQFLDWEIPTNYNTYVYIAELELRLKILRDKKPKEIKKMMSLKWDKKKSFFKLVSKADYLYDNESFFDSIYSLERQLEKQDIYEAINRPTYPLNITPPREQLLFIDQYFLSAEKKSQMSENVINNFNTNKIVTDIQKINTFIYINQNMNLTDWLYPIVSQFLKVINKKMRSYLKESANPESKLDADRKWFPVFEKFLVFYIDQNNFQGWTGLDRRQKSFFKLRAQLIATMDNPISPGYGNSGDDLPF